MSFRGPPRRFLVKSIADYTLQKNYNQKLSNYRIVMVDDGISIITKLNVGSKSGWAPEIFDPDSDFDNVDLKLSYGCPDATLISLWRICVFSFGPRSSFP